MTKHGRAKRRKSRAKKPAPKHSAWAKLRPRDVAALVDAVFTRRDPVTDAVELLGCERPTVRARVWERLLEYKYGRPAQRVVTSGPRGGPVRVEIISYIPRPRRERREG